MKLNIPDDWNGEDWFCAQVLWPDSPLFTALLVGFLSTMARGRFWDERTGSITDIQAIGKRVFNVNFPFRYCSETPDEVPDEVPDETVIDAIMEAMCMDCSIPYGALRWNGSDLEFRYCGEWYPVGGDREPEDWEDPGDGDTDPPPERDTATACSKTLVWCNTVYGIIEILLTQAVDDVNPFDALREVFVAYPEINFGNLDLFSAYLSALKIALVGMGDDATDAAVQQKMICRVLGHISEGDAGFTPDEYAAAKQAMDTQSKESFTFAHWLILDVEVENIYRKVPRSIGVNDSRKLTTMVLPDVGDDCDCGGPVEGSPIWFDGTSQGPGGGNCVMEDYTVVDSGRRVLCQMAGSSGVNRSMERFDFGLAGAANGDKIKFRLYMEPLLGPDDYMPSEAWEDYETDAPPEDWHPLRTEPQGVTEVRTDEANYVEFETTSDTGVTMLWCRIQDARFYPFDNDPDQGGWRSYFYIEIVSVNDVDLTPIGP